MSVYSTQPVPNQYSDFYGRDRIQCAERIITGLKSHEPRSWAIYGGRRMGKTSICYKVHQQLSRRYERDEVCCIPVYIDLSSFTLESKRYFFYIMASKLLDAVHKQEILSKDAISSPETINIFQLDRTSRDPVTDFKEFYNLLLAEIVRTYRQTRVIFLIDEVDHLSEHLWGGEIPTNLRAFIKNSSEFKYATYTALAMAGTNKSLSRLLAPGSPLRNELTKVVLRVFSLEDARQLISIYPYGNLDDDIVKSLYLLTGGHPYLLQVILGIFSEQKLYPIRDGHLRTVSQQFLTEQHVFRSWGTGDNGFSDTESQIYLELAKANRPLTKKKMQSLLAVSELDDALDTLICTGVVCEAEDGYRANGSLFREWYLTQNPKKGKETMSKSQPKNSGDMKQLIVSAFIVIFMLIATIIILTWAARQVSGLALIFIVTVGVVFALMNIIFVLVANGIISSRQTVAFYNRILDLVPPLGRFLSRR